jgi:hypothetical protein
METRDAFQTRLESGLNEWQRVEFKRLLNFGRRTIENVTELDNLRMRQRSGAEIVERNEYRTKIIVFVTPFLILLMQGILDFRLESYWFTLFGILIVAWYFQSELKELQRAIEKHNTNMTINLLSRDLALADLTIHEVLSALGESRDEDGQTNKEHPAYKNLDITLQTRIQKHLLG